MNNAPILKYPLSFLVCLFFLYFDFSSAIIYVPLSMLIVVCMSFFNEHIFKLGITRFYLFGIIASMGLIIGIFTPLNPVDKYALYSIPSILNLTYFLNTLNANFDILVHNIDGKNWFLAMLVIPILWLLSFEIFLTKSKKMIYLESIRVDAKNLFKLNGKMYYTFWCLFLFSAFLVSALFFFVVLCFFIATVPLKIINSTKLNGVMLLPICFMFLFLFVSHAHNIFSYYFGDSIRYINSMHLAYGFMLFKFDANISYGASLYLFCISVIAFVGEFIIGKNWNSVNENSQIKSLENLPIEKGFYIGDNVDSGKKIVLSLEELNQHMYVNATTGGGKTTLFLRMVSESLKFKMPVIYVDGKGSPDLIAKISAIAKSSNRVFRVFAFDNCDINASYDFFGIGNKDELRNKLMNLITNVENAFYYERLTVFITILFGLIEKGVKQGFISKKIDLSVIFELLSDNTLLLSLVNEVGDRVEKNYFVKMQDVDEKPQERIENILTSLIYSAYGQFLSINNSSNIINLADAIKNNEIILFLLNKSSYSKDTEQFGKIVIDDVNATFSSLAREKLTKPTLVILDEFASYASMSVATSLATHRSNGLYGVVGSQSLETIAEAEDGKVIVSSIVANTNTKIILRSINQFDLELFGNTVGTEKSYEMTHQMETGAGGATGMGSMRIGNKYKVDINGLRGLPAGIGYIYRVSTNKVDKVKVKV